MKIENFEISCSDNTNISATLYTPIKTSKAAVMIAPATGIKQEFYANFAKCLAENDFAVMTYDNRGIGRSLQGKLKKNKTSLQSWGQIDMPAVLDELKKRYPDSKYHLIGHSAGGQLVGLMPNSHDFSSMFNVACSSGRIANMKMPFFIQAHFFMNVVIPLSNLVFGYTKSQWVGMGEPLPKKVAQQWAKWCNGQGYVKTAFGKSIHKHNYDTLDFPSMWLNAIDDQIAINENVDDMLEVFPKLKAERLTLNPQKYGLKEIGHMKFFSRKNKVLWELALKWLEKE
jgi:predicted alpha/beta hydrolase